MHKKIYFAGSIRGGRSDAALYRDIIRYINETDTVLTEQVGDLNRSVLEQGRNKDALIYEKDIAMLKTCDIVIAECTVPSLGVGYELAYAEKLNKPVYVFYRHKDTQLSAMITGDPYFHIESYDSVSDLKEKIHKILFDD